jgi:hypothetical protein
MPHNSICLASRWVWRIIFEFAANQDDYGLSSKRVDIITFN